LLRGARAHREDQRDRLRQQAARDERERLRRGLVQPLRVIDHADKWSLLGHIGQQAQYRQPHQEPVRRAASAQPRRRAQRVALRAGKVIQVIQHGPAQLMQPREGQLHLRLHAGRPGDPAVRRTPHHELQQRRLARPRLTPQHQHRAPTGPRISHQPIKRPALTTAAPQSRPRISDVRPPDVGVDTRQRVFGRLA